MSIQREYRVQGNRVAVDVAACRKLMNQYRLDLVAAKAFNTNKDSYWLSIHAEHYQREEIKRIKKRLATLMDWVYLGLYGIERELS